MSMSLEIDYLTEGTIGIQLYATFAEYTWKFQIAAKYANLKITDVQNPLRLTTWLTIPVVNIIVALFFL